jgi:hypothetical protein
MARDSFGNVWFDVHAREHASSDDLVALGKALETWKARAGDVSIHGLDELLQGRYPAPCEPFTAVPDPQGEIYLGERGRFSIPTLWRYCFARVTTHERLMSEGELWRSLQEAVPADVGRVMQADTGHW